MKKITAVVAGFGNIQFVDEDVEEFIPAFADRIVHVHVKDYLVTSGNSREKAADEGQNVLFLCQDMRQLDLYGTVDTAVCMLDSLSHILHTDDLREIFRRLGLFIAPDGLLLFDVNTPYKHAHVLGDNAFVYERDEFVCTWRNRYLPATHEVEMALDFFLEEEDGTYSRYTDTVRERAYSLQTWKSLLTEAGFDLLGVYDERRFTAPGEDAQRWVLVARNNAIHQKND